MRFRCLLVLVLMLSLLICSSVLAAPAGVSIQPTKPHEVQIFGNLHWLHPAGGELAPGLTITIRWEYSGFPGQNAKIALLNNGQVTQVITPSTSVGANGKGHFAWQIPENIQPGSGYQLEIQSIERPQIKDKSQVFQLRGKIAVRSPNGGEAWLTKEPHSIDFAAAGCGPSVKIILLRNNVEVFTINPAFALNGSWLYSYKWLTPHLENSQKYQIKIVSTTNPTIFDISDGYLTITQKVF